MDNTNKKSIRAHGLLVEVCLWVLVLEFFT